MSIASTGVGPVISHLGIRMKHIGANPIPKTGGGMFALDKADRSSASSAIFRSSSRARKYFDRRFAILDPASFVLAGHDNARRDVSQPDRGTRFVDVLAPA